MNRIEKRCAKPPVFIENLRDAPLASLKFCLGDKPDSMKYIDALYDQYAIKAMKETIELLQSLENMPNSAAICSVEHIITSSLWFLSIETFISDLLSIFCDLTKKEFDKDLDLSQKIRKILELGAFSKKEFYECGYFQKLQEFMNLRNTLFHGGYHCGDLALSKTFFYPKTLQSNLIDTLQACVIALETFSIFGSVIAQHQLMPHYPIKNSHSLVFVRMDNIYEEYIVPYFNAILQKNNLTTNLQTSLIGFKLSPSNVISGEKVKTTMYANPQKTIPLSPNQTNLNDKYIKAILKYLSMDDVIIPPKYDLK